MKFYCNRCATVAKPKRRSKYPFVIGIFMIFPFVFPAFLYWLWWDKHRYFTCPACGAAEVIPTDSPAYLNRTARAG